MNGVTQMPPPKKKPSATEGGGEQSEKPEKVEQNPSVKLKKEFHRKLKIIAAANDIEMGALVEREMEDFIERELAALRKR